ncbi:MAG: hypothetical protein K9J85_01210 [Desulfobacteraceae bacterium]|nr:hypothetical protein [Desulfobacteraceae bacterium]
MGMNLAEKILMAHHVDISGRYLAIHPEQVLVHDATGTPVFLQLEAMGIKKVKLYAGSKILNPIRYSIAENHLQAKFSLPAELAMIAINRKAGKAEFKDLFVKSEEMQAMQRKISTEHDPEIEKLGFDKMRSRITIRLKDGRTFTDKAEEIYRGGPDNPLTDKELEEKVRACCEDILDDSEQNQLIENIWNINNISDVRILAENIQSGKE